MTPLQPDRRRPAADRRRALARLAPLAWACGALPAGLTAALAAPEPVTVRWPAVSDLDGRPLPAPWLRGNATLVVFFSTGCAFCARHNARLDGLMQRQPGLPLTVLLAAQDSPPEGVRQHLARHGDRFEATMDSGPLHAALSPRRVTPLTVVIDRAGWLRETIPGEMADDDVRGLARWARS